MLAEHCKVAGCTEKPTRIMMEGFCTTHFHQIKKGLLTEDGKPTVKALKIQKKQALKTWAVQKEEIAEKITTTKLKVLQTVYPETTKPVWCELMDFWTCEAGCFSRMFLWSPIPDECAGCHQNDGRLPFLKEFMGKENDGAPI